ncbi:FKBP-type peptidyl-prolyl cis-trans isomerase [Erythrobacter sp. W53]|uniref:FKBP-type peptidyl-prolyl cis-trans isomerase n=1 Tax=Erythrobacteraceae TaxID=335929 RepID=UPI0036D3EFBE
MTEVTRVPLQPIAKGSLTKLWLGVIIAIALAIGLAWMTTQPKGLSVETLVEGSGPNPTLTDVVFVNYKGMLADGTVFDESQQVPLPIEGIFPEGTPLPLDRMIPGFGEGAVQMQKGGSYVLSIPSDKGYGPQGQSNPQTGEVVIPPDADLVFEVELIDFMSQPDFERRLQTLQQAMQMRQNGEGGPPAGAPPQ